MKESIKAVAFDFGGVIEVNDSKKSLMEEIAELAQIPFADFRAEYLKRNHLTNVENLPWEDVVLKVLAVFTEDPKLKSEVASLMRSYRSKNRINQELVDLFGVLRRQGLKVAILSNYTAKLRGRLTDLGIVRLVDEIVVSGEIGFQKPHKEAFQALFEKLDLAAREVVFVDDSPKSLEKSGEIGYVPILFKNNAQLKKDLRALGISTDNESLS